MKRFIVFRGRGAAVRSLLPIYIPLDPPSKGDLSRPDFLRRETASALHLFPDSRHSVGCSIRVAIIPPSGPPLKGDQGACTQVSSLFPPYPDVKQIILNDGFALPEEAFQGEQWTLANKNTLTVIQKMERSSVPLKEYLNVSIFYGIKTGCDQAYVITSSERDILINEDPKSVEIIRPLAVGDDIRKWHIRDSQRYIILAKIGIDIKQYPAVLKHLKKHRERLEVRCDRGPEWWQLRSCKYYDIFNGPKIHYPEIAMEPRFTFDNNKTVMLKTAFTIPTNDLFLLAILNSEPAWYYLKKRCSVLGNAESRGRLTLQTVFVKNLPIPKVDKQTKEKLKALAKKCLQSRGADCGDIESEINTIANALYNL